MKKYCIITILLMVSIVLFTGCGFSKKSMYEKMGKKNAVQYIEEKYGFKPSVKSVKASTYNGSPIPFSTASATGYVKVKLKHEDTIFYVSISGLSKNTDGVDNYQVGVIEEAISIKLKEMVPNIINIDYCIGNTKVPSDDPYYGMISLKYDGNNLKEVLEDAQVKRIVVSLADSDLSDITEELIKETFGNNTDILFVNYKSVEDYQKAENTIYGLRDTMLRSGIDKNDAYIVEYKEF